jgi:C2 domain
LIELSQIMAVSRIIFRSKTKKTSGSAIWQATFDALVNHDDVLLFRVRDQGNSDLLGMDILGIAKESNDPLIGYGLFELEESGENVPVLLKNAPSGRLIFSYNMDPLAMPVPKPRTSLPIGWARLCLLELASIQTFKSKMSFIDSKIYLRVSISDTTLYQSEPTSDLLAPVFCQVVHFLIFKESVSVQFDVLLVQKMSRDTLLLSGTLKLAAGLEDVWVDLRGEENTCKLHVTTIVGIQNNLSDRASPQAQQQFTEAETAATSNFSVGLLKVLTLNQAILKHVDLQVPSSSYLPIYDTKLPVELINGDEKVQISLQGEGCLFTPLMQSIPHDAVPMPFPALLTLTLLAGVDLMAVDGSGTSDPYVTFKMNGLKMKEKSKTLKKTLNPLWNETFHIYVPDCYTSIIGLEVRDWNRIDSFEPMGNTSIYLATLLQNNCAGLIEGSKDTYLLALVNCTSGKLKISLQLTPANEADPKLLESAVAAWTDISKATIAGAVIGSTGAVIGTTGAIIGATGKGAVNLVGTTGAVTLDLASATGKGAINLVGATGKGAATFAKKGMSLFKSDKLPEEAHLSENPNLANEAQIALAEPFAAAPAFGDPQNESIIIREQESLVKRRLSNGSMLQEKATMSSRLRHTLSSKKDKKFDNSEKIQGDDPDAHTASFVSKVFRRKSKLVQ